MQFIVLVGPKHSGKTSAGRELASLLSCGFADLDEVIVQQTSKSPRALFAEGPEVFRKAEEAALAAVLETGGEGAAHDSQRLAVAAGGGIIDNPGALTLLRNSSAVFIFLDVAAETAWERISREGELPPFLGSENPKAAHRNLHERRSAAYRQMASCIINADGKSPAEIAVEIFHQL